MEQLLIAKFKNIEFDYWDAMKQMEKHFRYKIKEPLENATTKEDFEAIRWMVAPMPDCSSKVLIFRTIILTEEKILKS